MKLIKEVVIPASICDTNVKLSVKGAFDLVQDYLTEMMSELQIDGVSLRKKYGCVWIFTRNRIQIDRAPDWKEHCIVESYISSAKGAKMTVDTMLKNREGEICVYSRVEMCAIDLQTQRIKRVRDVGVTSEAYVEASERDIEFSRLKHEGLRDIATLTVQSGDIDFIQHTNNVSYVRFVMNTYTVQQINERPVREIEVRYASQTHEGDTLTIRKAVVGEKEFFDIVHEETVAVDCEIIR